MGDAGIGEHPLDVVLHQGGDVADGHRRHGDQPQHPGPGPQEGHEGRIEDPEEGAERGGLDPRRHDTR